MLGPSTTRTRHGDGSGGDRAGYAYHHKMFQKRGINRAMCKLSKKVQSPCVLIRIGKMGKQCAKLKWIVSKIMILRVVFSKNSKGKYIK